MYDKLTLQSFRAKLKNGDYVNATGARRAVGKATSLDDAEKKSAQKAIDAHFASDAPKAAPAAKKAAEPKAPRAKTVKTDAPMPTAAKAAAKTPRKAMTAGATAGRKGYTGPGAIGKEKAQDKPAPFARELVGETFRDEDFGSISTQLRIAEKTIQNVGSALNVLCVAKDRFPTAGLEPVVEEMGGTISAAVNIYRSVINQMANYRTEATPALPPIPPQNLASAHADEEVDAPAPIATATGNGAPKTHGETLFTESAPPA
jgi:hypothetical protein